LPAIFWRRAPADTDPNWTVPQWTTEPTQYPRIVYIFDRANSNSDILVGQLHVQAWGRQDHVDQFDAIVSRVSKGGILQDAAFNTDEGLVLLRFAQAVPFNGDPDADVFGIEFIYDVRAFDTVTTYAPDPIAALNRFVTQYLDSRLTVSPASWAPADDKPAVYFRPVSRVTPTHDLTNWGFWDNVRIECRVFAPSVYSRSNWIRLIAGAFKIPKMRNIRLEDGSTMRIMAVTEDFNASPLDRGQIQIDVRYGVLDYYLSPGPHEAPLSFTNPPIPTSPVPVPPPPVTTLPTGTPTPPDVWADTGARIAHFHIAGDVDTRWVNIGE
jgi:hypothetical protein